MKEYITCDVINDQLVPMGFSKDYEKAKELAKLHGQTVYKLVPILEPTPPG